MFHDHDDHLTDESGVALVAALLAVVILTGLAIVFVATAVSTSRSTAFSRDFEIAVHVAEAGADEIISRVNWEKDYVTTDSDGNEHELDLDDHPDAETQREWVLEQVRGDPDPESLMLVTGVSGAGFGIRPLDPDTGEAHDVIFGVSFVPSLERPERVRVVRMNFQREYFQPQHGIQGCGDLTVRGSASIEGEHGSVHANGDVDTHGSSYYVEQGITASGTVSPSGAGEGGHGAEECPEIHAEDFYAQARPPFTCYSGDENCEALAGVDGNMVRWWDLCPDGTAREAGSAPCTGEVVYDQATAGGAQPHDHKGWTFKTTGGDPRWQTQNIQSGVFYVHGTNARVEGSGNATATIVVAKDESDDGRSGNLHFRGSGKIVPALEGTVLVTDRDLAMPGAPGGGEFESQGMIAVGEQADLAGTASFNGPVYIRDDPHTTHSPVSESEVRGTFSVTYDEELDITLLGSIRITAWNELR